jgi:tRNA U34 5-methylaminomethyl-2-thiouridine-forming methyltransferase MnmC
MYSAKIKDTVITNDGSHTFYVAHLDEYYHSIHGALQESMHVFIQSGLHHLPQAEIAIFEMGFGTGLNTFLTYLEAKKHHKTINYFSIEAYPIEIEKALQLNYAQQINAPEEQHIFSKIHQSNWNEKIDFDNFNLTKINQKIENFDENSIPKCDLIYFDAFAPSAQPHLWEENVLQKMHNLLKPNGILVTYCAKGSFKRSLKSLGFAIEALAGPVGKREITRATKTN